MPFVPPRDRVLETSTSNSQSVFALAGALDTSFNRFSASMAVGDTTIGGVVEAGVAFKSGILTYSATNEITVSTVKESKGTFSTGGVKQVFMGLPGLAALMVDGAQALTAAQKAQARSNIAAVLKGHLAGLTLSAAGGTGTFGIAAGEAADSTAADLMALATAYTKTTSAWAVGSGNGALDTGTVAAGTWYHVHLIKRPDSGVTDVLVSLSATAPTLPANYTLFRRIGAMLTNGSSQWIKFSQLGDEFLWDVRRQDLGATTCPTSATLHVLSVPSGVPCTARVMLRMDYVSSNVAGLLTSPDESDQVPGGLTVTQAVTSGSAIVTANVDVRTNASSQVRVRFSGATATYSLLTYGYFDRRGRD